jgi:DNA-binding Lrp family transcriptional regulator
MDDERLDELDRAILYELQQDARNNTNTDIAERVDVSPSTVGKRISRLEEEGVIKGYRPEIDYEQAGFPLHVVFICTTSITDRESLIEEALNVETVVNVQEMMTGERNVLIEVVARANEEVTRAARRIDDLGFTVTDEILKRAEYPQPSVVFADEDDG